MLIISNSCVGGFLYRDFYKVQYNNPFIWSSIPVEEMIKMINNFNNINWYNYKIILIEAKSVKKKYVRIIVDDKFYINFPHHIYINIEKQHST